MKRLIPYLVAVLAALTALTRLGKPVEKLFPHCPVWLWISLAFLPLLVALLLSLLRTGWRISSGVITTGYFKVTPYEDTPSDLARFNRADLAHKQIKDWLSTTTDSLVYLTAVSGAGKSSLLNAYVIPQLRNSGVVVITVRSFGDPLAGVQSSLLTPGLVWERPPAATGDLRYLLEKAADRLGKRRLLIIFDQFEEFLILHERERASLQATQEFLSSLGKKPIDGMTVLIVMRSDYVGLLHDFIKSTALPAMNDYSNWKTISAFRERDARAFLEKSGLDIEPQLMDEVFTQIRMVEETDGLVRPITVNMVGMILDRYSVSRKRVLRRASREGLITGYIRNCLGHSNVRDHCRQILRRMITQEGTKTPKTILALSHETRIVNSSVMGCLNHLALDGIVRPLDVGQDTWEISHDFVAKVVERVLGTWHKGVWLMIRQWAFPVSIVLWLGLFVALPRAYHSLRITKTGDVTARVFLSSKEPGNPDMPTSFGCGTVAIYASSPGKTNVGELLALTSYRDQEVTPEFRGETGEEQADAVAVFSSFVGHLGAFRDRAAWRNAIVEGELTWSAHSDWDSEKADELAASLVVYIDGDAVATIPGVAIEVGGSGFHNMPYEYQLRFPKVGNEVVPKDAVVE